MKLTTGILAIAMVVGGTVATKVVAQNSDAIDNARSTAKALQQKQANDPSPTPAAAAVPAKAKPAPGAPASAIKPVATLLRVFAHRNQLQRVNVVPEADSVQIEISSSQSVTPRLSKLNSPDRVVVELPETVMASSQSKISVGSAGVKGVRIGMDGKTPPTTSVVIDLEKPLAYELTPGSAGKVILTLHSQGAAPSVAKNSPAPPRTVSNPAPVKAASPALAGKAATAATAPTATAKTAILAPKVVDVKASAGQAKAPAAKPEPILQAKIEPPAKNAVQPKQPRPEEKAKDKKWALTGKRDPFFSPVVQQNGSGCSTGKKCLEIGAINLRGVVKSDAGFIAVVTNSLNKAYFLRENDPVFNGFVVKITGDSVVFRETIQDKLGKAFTREVVKRIFTPAV
ncbi:MAG TPA: AMIN domain-containing protein [Candidatus Acidoferrum sp.]|nr:AMIN domain-containing protein [Candidatus Acidoferrum sp.]